MGTTASGCAYKSAVKSMRIQLRKVLPKNRLPSKCASKSQIGCPCPSFFDHTLALYDVASGDCSGPILELIQSMFGSTPAVGPDFSFKTVRHSKFYCPELRILMYQPCEVDTCQYHTEDNAWTGNCILRFLTKQGVQELGYDDLAYLTGIPQSELKTRFSSIKRELRNGALKEAITKDDSFRLFDRIYTNQLCPVCEKRVVPKERVVSRGYHYCSQICADYKPPVILRLEHEFCIDILDLLRLCIDLFSSTKEMSTALGISKAAFETLCASKGIDVPQNKL